MLLAAETAGIGLDGRWAASADMAAPGTEELLKALQVIEAELRIAATVGAGSERVHPAHRRSVTNLTHYLALRGEDLRPLQTGLARLGLSSLGRSEGHILATVQQVRAVLEMLTGREAAPADAPPVGFDDSQALLAAKTEALFGPGPTGRATRIMVTMPSEAADDYDLVVGLVRRGMDCARINGAHDGPETWAAMAGHVRRAAAEAGRVCLVQVDLAGPKLRTGQPAGKPGVVKVGKLPAGKRSLRLKQGDLLGVTRSVIPSGEGTGPARIGCTLPEIFDHLAAGDHIWFDDGCIGGVVTSVSHDDAVVEIHWAPPSGAKLRAEKGINLPDTDLHLPAIGPDDEAALAFAASQADLVALSFVQRPSDIEDLQARLATLGGDQVGIVLKIETQKAFARLPSLLLAAMASERVGVMIARGDLAVECGFERLAEVQEEILWLCEAAHLPVIWATQVLDQLARTGRPSRAEITDAAMAERAECVMLNKGPYIPEAVSTLDDILRRMAGHQQKKNPLLRQLRAWSDPGAFADLTPIHPMLYGRTST